jgi:hypothetical protein
VPSPRNGSDSRSFAKAIAPVHATISVGFPGGSSQFPSTARLKEAIGERRPAPSSRQNPGFRRIIPIDRKKTSPSTMPPMTVVTWSFRDGYSVSPTTSQAVLVTSA